MIELKPGNGGYGLEAYDTETGKYASNVSISVEDENGQKHSFANFKDFLKTVCGNQFLQQYEDDEEFRKMIHEYQGDDGLWQVYESLLRQEVDKLNAEEIAIKTNVEFFETSTEVAANAYKFFTKEVIDDMLSKDILKNNYLKYTKDGSGWGSCNKMAELFRIARYGNTKMQPITKQEFLTKCGDFATNDISHSYSGIYNRIQEVKSSPNKCVPLYRGMSISDKKKDQVALASHYKTDFDPSESLYFTGSGYYESVIYMSGSESYVKYGYSNTRQYLHAYVELNDDYKIAYCPKSHKGNKEIENFINHDYKTFVVNLVDHMQKNGYDLVTSYDFANLVEEQITDRNIGFVAMLFGYDGICGDDGQFDQLNMAKVKCVDEGWF